MIDYKAFIKDACNLTYTTVRRGKALYINMPCAMDIETSSVVVEGEKSAFSYIWMVGFEQGGKIYYGRTWDEFLEFYRWVIAAFQINTSKRLVIYIHNLSYEFQFMRKLFAWESVFAVSDRRPIKALTIDGIEFRDSYILSGMSLAGTAKNLTKYRVEKAVGDLDYSLVRTPLTPLSDAEMNYCSKDIEVLTAYIQEQIEYYGDVTKIPATNTGRVRNFVRDNCYYVNGSHKKVSSKKYRNYRKLMEQLTLTPEHYRQINRAFMGGYTHASAYYSGQTLTGVSSYDFTSSYPSVMISEKFPMSRFTETEVDSIEQLEHIMESKAVIFDLTLRGVEPKFTPENYISASKCRNLKGEVINNGRIAIADELTITITEVDYQIIKETYSYDEIAVTNILTAYKGFLPKDIITSTLELYQKKTVLKDVEGEEAEYLLSKGMLNSIYGMSVTAVIKNNATYEDSWNMELANPEEVIEKYNSDKKRFLYYPWGVYVTAYARRNLWSGILAIGEDYVYSDTDSIKLLNHEKHADYINDFNEAITLRIEDVLNHYGLDKSLMAPKTKEGISKPIGVWDFEGVYDKFKTLGAKRYLTAKKGKTQLTVAGLGKQNGMEYMLELAHGSVDDVFDIFTDNLYIPADRTGKMTHSYIDHEMEYQIADYNGVRCDIITPSGIHLESCEFTLSIPIEYRNYLKLVASGTETKGLRLL